MRLTTLPNFLRTVCTISNATSRVAPALRPSVSFQQQFRSLQSSSSARVSSPHMPFPFLSSIFGSQPTRKMVTYPVQKSEDEWVNQLKEEGTEDEYLPYNVLRNSHTEAPGKTSKYNKHFPSKDSTSVYACRGCDTPLYKAEHKYDSGCGWPAFWDAIPGAVERHEDRRGLMVRTEIRCTKCGGHLGHVFKGEGHGNPTDERHCVNSVSVNWGDYMPKETNGNAEGKADGESKDSKA